MPTFLTTSKMHPALAARVEASVRGNRGAARTRRVMAIARLVFVLTAAFATYATVTSKGGCAAPHATTR